MLPQYLAKAAPNPTARRAPWYANTAPSYAGIFLWIVFYQQLAGGTLAHAGLGFCLAALLVAGLLCYFLYYVVPATMGMRTGFPLYVVGSSTFGTSGGYIMPGLLMGLLQIGWFAVATYFASDFILKGLHIQSQPGTMPFIVTGVLWGVVMAWVGTKGMQYLSRVSLILNAIPLVMLLVVCVQTAGSAGNYHVPAGQENNFLAFTGMLAAVIGFFATAGAAGTDFGTNARDDRDVRWGGIVGIIVAAMVAGGLPLIAVAGAHGAGLAQGFDYGDIIQGIGGPLSSVMFFLFAVASIPATCFCATIAGNSFSTMIPGVPRVSSSWVAAIVGMLLAVTGIAANLIGFFNIVGASFGPIVGAMVADYLLSGRRWAGPREGVNMAGYLAWAIGFVVGILPFLPLPADVQPYVQPAVLYSFVTGFVVYAVLAKLGLQPKTVEMPKA